MPILKYDKSLSREFVGDCSHLLIWGGSKYFRQQSGVRGIDLKYYGNEGTIVTIATLKGAL